MRTGITGISSSVVCYPVRERALVPLTLWLRTMICSPLGHRAECLLTWVGKGMEVWGRRCMVLVIGAICQCAITWRRTSTIRRRKWIIASRGSTHNRRSRVQVTVGRGRVSAHHCPDMIPVRRKLKVHMRPHREVEAFNIGLPIEADISQWVEWVR